MRRGRIFFFLAFILILGLVAVFVVYQRFMTPGPVVPDGEVGVVPTEAPTVDVVVMAQRVARGQVLEEDVLTVVPVPDTLVNPGMVTSIADAVGRRAKYELEAGTFLMGNLLVDSAQDVAQGGSAAALVIPPGMVAVSIPINRLSAVSYAPQPGDHVNVIATMALVDLDTDFQTILPNRTSAVIASGPGVIIGSGTEEESATTINPELGKVTAQSAGGGPVSLFGRGEVDPVLGQTFYVIPSEAQRPRLVSQALLQDAVILRVGDFPLEGETVATDQQAAEGEIPPLEGQPVTQEEPGAVAPEQQKPDVVTLIVSPQDAVTLNYMIYSGAQLTLALRAADDNSRVQTEAVTLQFLLDQYQIPVPVKLPYGMNLRIQTEDVQVPPSIDDFVIQPVATEQP